MTSSTVVWTVQDNTASKADDLISPNTHPVTDTLTFSQDDGTHVTAGYGEQTETVRVYIQGDNSPEANESLSVSLSNATGGAVIVDGKTVGSGTILNDDTVFSLMATGPLVKEGDAQGQEFTVTRSRATTQDQTVHWSVAGNGSHAADSADFDHTSGVVVFTGNETSATFFVKYASDSIAELDEHYMVTLSLGNTDDSEGTLNDTINSLKTTAVGTILNDDAVLSVSIDEGKQSIREGNSTDSVQPQIEFVVTRSGDTSGTANATWTLSGDAANVGYFSSLNGTVSFLENESSTIVYVPIVPNSDYVGNKAFTVTLTENVGGQVSVLTGIDDTASGTIVDDDSTVSLHADASLVEGDSGTKSLVFTVDRSGSTAYDSAIGWRVVTTGVGDGHASAADFSGGLPSGVLTLRAGESSTALNVSNILSDSLFEGDETFTVELVNPSVVDNTLSHDGGLTIDPAKVSAIGTITNDDDRMSIIDAATSLSVAENSGSFTFEVHREGSISGNSTVKWRIVNALTGSTYNGTGDFAKTEGVVSFGDGVSSQTVTVNITNDLIAEGDEPFRIELFAPGVGSNIDTDLAGRALTVTNDDVDNIRFAVVPTAQPEGDGAGHVDYTVTVTRDNATTTATVDWHATGSGIHALDDQRFVLADGLVSFDVGQTSKTFTISVASDDIGEYDQTFDVSLNAPHVYVNGVEDTLYGAQVVTQPATLTVANDDPAFIVALTSHTFVEGSGTNSKLITFDITRSGDLSGSAILDWAISADGNSAHPVNISDFGGYWPSGTTAFASGESVKHIQVAIAPDANFEPSEGFTVQISGLTQTYFDSGARILVDSVSGLITNDDIGVSVGVDQSSVIEGNSGDRTSVNFTISAEGMPNKTVTATFVLEGSGLSPANQFDFEFDSLNSGYAGNLQPYWDFDSSTGTGWVTLRTDVNGYANATVTAVVNGDNIAGANETFRLRVEQVVGGTVVQGQGQSEVIIENDDTAIASIVLASTDTYEGNSGTKNFTFVLTRSGSTLADADVSYVIEGFGDNQADALDFDSGGSLPQGTAHFSAGSATATIDVLVAGDTVFESNEGFIVVVGKDTPNEARMAAVIKNDDSSSLEVNGLSTTVTEGNDAQAPHFLSFEIVRNGDNSQPLDVDYSITGDVGLEAFINPPAKIHFAENQSRVVFNLAINPNLTENPDMNISLQVDATGTGFAANPAAVSGTIRDDDSGISIAVVNASQPEGNSAQTLYEFTVVRSGNATGATEVNWTLEGIGINPTDSTDFMDATPIAISFAAPVDNGDGTTTYDMSRTIQIVVNNDAIVENDETFRVSLVSSSDTNQKILVAHANATVLNDDNVSDAGSEIHGGDGLDVLRAGIGNDTVFGHGGADVIYGGDGNDMLNGGGGADQMYGGLGDDTLVISADNLPFLTGSGPLLVVDGGLGIDTLIIGDSLPTLDLTNLQAHISSIEKIDISGSGFNTLQLDSVFLMNQTIDAFFQDGTRQLLVNGDVGDDSVVLADAGWTTAGTWTDGLNNHYDVYTHFAGGVTDAELLVKQGVSVVI